MTVSNILSPLSYVVHLLHDCSRATSLFLDAQPAALHLTPDNQQKALHTIGGNNTHI
jgi:hypothetical protein